MRMNSNIPLSIQPFDFAGSAARGAELANTVNTIGRGNALAEVYRTQGPGIISGDQGAINALAMQDPMAAMNVQSARLGMDRTRQQMRISEEELKMAYEDAFRQSQEYAAGLTAEQRAAEAEQMDRAINAAAMAQTPEEFDLIAEQFGAPELKGQFELREPLLASVAGAADALKAFNQGGMDAKDRYRNVEGFGLVDLTAEGGPKPVDLGERAAPQVDPGAVDSFRKEFSGLPAVKSFSTQSEAYSRIAAAAQEPSAAGDLALIFSYMKMLDPGSVVREGEFANAQNAAGIPERIRAQYNNIMNGERLTEATRADFLSRADKIYSGAEREYGAIEKQFRAIAEGRGYPVDQSLIDFRYTGERVLGGQAESPRATQINGWQIEAIE